MSTALEASRDVLIVDATGRCLRRGGYPIDAKSASLLRRLLAAEEAVTGRSFLEPAETVGLAGSHPRRLLRNG